MTTGALTDARHLYLIDIYSCLLTQSGMLQCNLICDYNDYTLFSISKIAHNWQIIIFPKTTPIYI